MLQRPKPGELLGSRDAPFADVSFVKSYPNLAAMLTELQYADNQPRTTSTLLVFCENGVLRVCLNDRDNNRSAFFTAETFEDALQTIDDALATGKADWRSRRDGVRTPF